MVSCFKSVYYVEVRGRMAACNSGAINAALGFRTKIHNLCQSVIENMKLNEMNKWLDPVITDQEAPNWLVEGVQIEKKGLERYRKILVRVN